MSLVPLIDGVTWGLMLVLISLGLTLIFGFLGIVNFAHGAFFMLGGYMVVTGISQFGSFWIGLVLSLLVVGLVGAAFEVTLFRPLYEEDAILQLIITFAIILVLQGVAIFFWGLNPISVDTPAMLQGSITVGSLSYPLYRLITAVIAVAFILLVGAILRFTTLGLLIRASLTDKDMVRALGYNVPLMFTAVFAGGVALAGISGALMTPLRGVGLNSATDIILQMFVVVIVGGLGSYRGTILAGIGIGILDVGIASYVSYRLSGITIFLILLVVLVTRPHGLLGEKSVSDIG